MKINEFIKMLIDKVDNNQIFRKGIFDDNIRDYCGTTDKIEVNKKIKKQLLSDLSFLFGMLNNAISVICDEVRLNSEDLTLNNY